MEKCNVVYSDGYVIGDMMCQLNNDGHDWHVHQDTGLFFTWKRREGIETKWML